MLSEDRGLRALVLLLVIIHCASIVGEETAKKKDEKKNEKKIGDCLPLVVCHTYVMVYKKIQ